MATEDIGALVVRIETDLKNFNNGINQVGEKVNTLGSTIKKVGGLIAGAFAVKAVVGGIKDLTDATMEAERASNRLDTLARNVPGTTQEQIDALKKLADERQKLTTVEGDAMIAGQSQLATFQLSTSTIAKLTPAFADLAVATYGANVSQEQMIQSGNLIGKVMQGNVGALSRVGVSFTAAQEKILKTGTEAEKTAALVEVLGQNFGGLAESTRNTTEGAIIAMNNAWGDMKEVLGGFLLPILGQVSTWFSSKIPVIQDTLTGAFTTMQGVVSSLGGVFSGTLEKVGPIAESFVATIRKAFQGDAEGVLENFTDVVSLMFGFDSPMAQSILAFAYDGVGPLIESIKSMGTSFMGFVQKVYPIIVEAFNYISNKLLPPVIDIYTYLATEIVPLLAAKFQEWMPVIADIVKGMADAIKIAVNIITTIFNVAWPLIKGVVLVAVDAIGNTISGLLKTLKGVTDFIAGVFTGDWRRAWGGIKNIFSGIWDAIGGVIKGAINEIIVAINFLIRAMNKIKVNIPDWVPRLGGKGFGINIPEIPKLAQGTNFFKGGLAMVGEAGRELVNLPRGSQVIPNRQTEAMMRQTINYEGMFAGAIFNVRSDNDAKLIAREIFNLQTTRSRGNGVVYG